MDPISGTALPSSEQLGGLPAVSLKVSSAPCGLVIFTELKKVFEVASKRSDHQLDGLIKSPSRSGKKRKEKRTGEGKEKQLPSLDSF